MGATWALARGIAQLTPVLDLQDWAMRAFLIVCAIGLPITLVVTWNFEGILDWIRQLVSVEPSPPSDAASASPQETAKVEPAPEIVHKSVAVLPFADFRRPTTRNISPTEFPRKSSMHCPNSRA